jgi:HAE1 family hydrophobic/amphiphilic exporter-1
MGGMIMGTVIGVLIIPGLYFLFATLVDGKNLLKDEVHTSITSILEHPTEPLEETQNEAEELVSQP